MRAPGACRWESSCSHGAEPYCLPRYSTDIVSRIEHTYTQLIYTIDLPVYARDRICVIGDAGIVVQPLTRSGIFKRFNNARDLVAALEEHDSVMKV